ncbi:hypothetical protein ACFYKX_26715 [Cytobacillus sp. FJAT-54145]|uniref:LPS export ABC transporter periplasmic protein LptC n=1 Tax=Cytobacillus spartinae TaxID=3299023 RepID=A0ABW6KIZ1_9BACI
MVESKKDKRIRFFLIFCFASLVMVGFYYQSKQTSTYIKEPHPMAVVIKEGSASGDNPYVGIYDYRDQKHLLALYEIEQNNFFHFKTLKATALKESPEQLANDASGNGLWVRVSGIWHYFNPNLEIIERDEKYRISKDKLNYSVHTSEEGNVVTISDSKKIVVERNEVVYGVHSLSNDSTVWLLMTDKGAKISIIETK